MGAYAVTNPTVLESLLPSSESYVTSIAVSWESPSGTSPSATHPLTLVLTDSNILVGDVIYEVTSTGIQKVGVAAQNGVATVTFSTDPTFLIAKPALLTQAALTLSSRRGVAGRPLTLAASGGSGTGGLTFTVTAAGTTGCFVKGSVLHAPRAGTCVIVATKASDGTYAASTSAPLSVVFTARKSSLPLARRTLGVAGRGRTSLIEILGSGFYGRPTVESNQAAVRAYVTADNGRVLKVQVLSPYYAHPGVGYLTLRFSKGRVLRIRYLTR
ncbi:MAG: hypothetical protein B7X07_05895 [Actinobacteria bacterium 21-64-8]|nr:MAG: hypothetical protein B7X07_05895 [Actinobacteria bacterium 21-64-8]